jgi:hypothetical protein
MPERVRTSPASTGPSTPSWTADAAPAVLGLRLGDDEAAGRHAYQRRMQVALDTYERWARYPPTSRPMADVSELLVPNDLPRREQLLDLTSR